MIRPLLIIGVGGSGGKTIRAMKQELIRILESSGYSGEIPDAWQFLHIDTIRDGESFPAPMLANEEIHCVVPPGAKYVDILRSITARCSQQEQQSLLAGWGFPAPDIWDVENDPVILAGKARFEFSKRAPNRLLLLTDSAKTLKRLQNSISKMQSPTALSELATVARYLGARILAPSGPEVLIFSSLGGAAGSGMFFDIAELLKRSTSQSWVHNSTSFLYTPEVFEGIGIASVSGIAKNTFGAFNELIASRWVGLSAQTELLYSKMGLVASNTLGQSEFGCRTNILIGAENTTTGIDIRVGAENYGIEQVFLTTGQAIAGIVSNGDTSNNLFNRMITTIWSCRLAIDISGLAPEASNVQNPSMTASAIGFGKLSSGVEHIVDYVADALTKRQVEKLLWPELTPALLKGGISVPELIQEKADEIWPKFLLDSGLDERESENQIIDALLPDQSQERIKQFVIGIIKKNISATPRPLAEFSKAIWAEWETQRDTILWTFKSEIRSKAQEWVPSIQEQLRDQISHELTLNGYAVLTNLTECLEAELRDHVMPKLLRDHVEFSNAVCGFDQKAFNKRVTDILDGLTTVSTQNGPFFQKLSASFARVLEFQINSYVNALAASLVEDVLSFLVTPLKEQLKDSRLTLQIIQKANVLPDGSKNPYLNYPDWASGVVPNRYKPKILERILIDPEEFESIYEFYASKDFQGAPAFQRSVGSALLGKKMNPMPGDVNPQTLITVSSPWITSVRDAQGTSVVAVSKSEWNFHTDIAELSKRNRRWLKQKESAFGKLVNISIRDFIGTASENPQIRDQREVSFVKEFEAMLNIARPLVKLNANALRHILGVNDGNPANGVLLESSRIPFDFNSRIGQACSQVLQQFGYNPADPSFEHDWFDPGSKETSMIAVSAIQNPLPVWAFASLTEPILEELAKSNNHTQTWVQFWDGRRSRPLVEAVPFETEIRRSIITGWFLAGLFGLRKIENLKVGRSLKIWNPTLETPEWSRFPSPLLNSHPEDMKRESWLLPQLLMSAGIALAQFGKSGNPDFINGYRLLKFLGREVTTSFKNRDLWDGNGIGDMLPNGLRAQSTYIENWLKYGTKLDEKMELSNLLQKNLTANPDRKAALISSIETLQSSYQEVWKESDGVPFDQLPETWELREDIDSALSDILEYVRSLYLPRKNDD